MKKRNTLIVSILAIGLSYLLLSYNVVSESDYETLLNADIIEIPSDIHSILENKCFKCHTSESKGSKSKLKLNFDKFTNGDYSNGKLVSKFGKITKQLNNNKMPPKKHLAKNPDQKLSSEESKLIISWATEQGNILAGE
jgi:hypothetical protein